MLKLTTVTVLVALLLTGCMPQREWRINNFAATPPPGCMWTGLTESGGYLDGSRPYNTSLFLCCPEAASAGQPVCRQAQWVENAPR